MIRIIVLVLLITSCSDRLDKQTHDLVEGKNKWSEAISTKKYSFEYTQHCYCPWTGELIKFEADYTGVKSAVLGNGKLIDPDNFPNIELHFQRILHLLQKQEEDKNVSVSIEYDGELGFPTVIEYRQSNVSHGEYKLEIKNVQVIGR